MNCSSCGLQLPQGAKHCPRCGATTPYNYSSTGTAPDDATYISMPYAATQQAPSTAYGSQPEGANPPTQYATTPYAAGPQTPSGSPAYGATPQNPYSTSPYDPYNPPPPMPIPAPVPPPKRQGISMWIIVGVVVLLLILIGGGVFGLLRYTSARNAAAAAAVATATAQVNATATASAVVAAQNPYTHNGTLSLSDPLIDNSKGHGWSEDAPNCTFTTGTYHAIAPDPHYPDYCLARASNYSNFAFEVQMKIIKGDAGGIVFRVEDTNPNKLYAFYIGQDGSYNLNLQDPSGFPLLTSGSNPAINRGLNQTNLIAVVAQGSTITLYVNHQPIDKVTNNTYSGGQLGVFSVPYTQPTEVVFSNAKVWKM